MHLRELLPALKGHFFSLCILMAEGQWPLSCACDGALWKWTSVCPFQSYCTSHYSFFFFVCSFLKEIVPIQLTSLSFRSHTVGKIVPHKQSLPQPLAVLHMHHIVPSSSFPIVWSHFQLGLFLRWLCEEPWKCSSSSPMVSDRLCMV